VTETVKRSEEIGMGFKLSWFAVRGKTPEAVRGEAGLVATGVWEEVPEAPFSGLALDSEWYVVLCTPIAEWHLDEGWLRRLSSGCEVVTCLVHENSAVSAASGWQCGQKLWSLSHDCEQGVDHLDSWGDLPSEFAEIHERARMEQAEDLEVDYLFDVPIDVAAASTGFDHARVMPDAGEWPFEVLEFGCVDSRSQPGFSDCSLTLESRPIIANPTQAQIERAIQLMSPQGGPGFVILEGPGGDYAQAAGGDDAFTAEWREYRGEAFTHWVAGHRGLHRPGKVSIPTNGYKLTVKASERLRARDVAAILLAFARGAGRPDSYSWRDMTRVFD